MELDTLFARFHIVPKNVALYEQAFTHASYTNEHKECPSYDRLEFLGDSLLDMIVGDMVFHANKDGKSGELTKMRAALVSGPTLTELSETVYGLDQYVRYSQGEKDNVKFHKHIHEDVFESFIAAVYLDQGYEFVRNLVIDIFAPMMEKSLDISFKRDSKSRLQEVLNGAVVQYVVIKQENINTEDVSFTVEARLGSVSLGIGKGHNTKEAEINAASDALSKKVGN